MSVTFCRFTDANGLEIIINPASVRYLAGGPQGTTRICFDNTHTVNVRGLPRQVEHKLAGGSDEMEVWSPPPRE